MYVCGASIGSETQWVPSLADAIEAVVEAAARTAMNAATRRIVSLLCPSADSMPASLGPESSQAKGGYSSPFVSEGGGSLARMARRPLAIATAVAVLSAAALAASGIARPDERRTTMSEYSGAPPLPASRSDRATHHYEYV